MTEPIRIALVGAAGRMGREVIAVAAADPNVEIAAELEAHDDVPGALLECDVAVDFSSPDGLMRALSAAREKRCAFVSGTTGLSPAQRAALDDAATEIPLLWAANFSVGVNVLEHLVEEASRALDGFDLEIFEAHHKHKVDAPSGTAKLLGRAAARGRERSLDDIAVWAREGAAGPRDAAEIGFQVVRGGSIVGEHTVFLCGAGERVELTHRAQDRAIFARGAVLACRWLVGRPPGRYSMKDVLGLS